MREGEGERLRSGREREITPICNKIAIMLNGALVRKNHLEISQYRNTYNFIHRKHSEFQIQNPT